MAATDILAVRTGVSLSLGAVGALRAGGRLGLQHRTRLLVGVVAAVGAWLFSRG